MAGLTTSFMESGLALYSSTCDPLWTWEKCTNQSLLRSSQMTPHHGTEGSWFGCFSPESGYEVIRRRPVGRGPDGNGGLGPPRPGFEWKRTALTKPFLVRESCFKGAYAGPQRAP